MKTQKQEVLVEQQQNPSGSQHTSLLTPNHPSPTNISQFPSKSSWRKNSKHLVPHSKPAADREETVYLSVHKPSKPQDPDKEFTRHFRACNNKFHPCHHNRRVRRTPRDRKDIEFNLLQPHRALPPSPLACQTTDKGKRRSQGEPPKGQLNGKERKVHVKAQDTWPPGCPGDVDSKAQSPFISGHSFTIGDGGNQEYIPIKIEDFLSPR